MFVCVFSHLCVHVPSVTAPFLSGKVARLLLRGFVLNCLRVGGGMQSVRMSYHPVLNATDYDEARSRSRAVGWPRPRPIARLRYKAEGGEEWSVASATVGL